jgi:hypothetical protein
MRLLLPPPPRIALVPIGKRAHHPSSRHRRPHSQLIACAPLSPFALRLSTRASSQRWFRIACVQKLPSASMGMLRSWRLRPLRIVYALLPASVTWDNSSAWPPPLPQSVFVRPSQIANRLSSRLRHLHQLRIALAKPSPSVARHNFRLSVQLPLRTALAKP